MLTVMETKEKSLNTWAVFQNCFNALEKIGFDDFRFSEMAKIFNLKKDNPGLSYDELYKLYKQKFKL